MIYSLLIFVHIMVCIFLTVAILLQSSKGGGLAGTFGGSGSIGAVFGGRGAAPVLSKLTVGLAVVFMVLSLILGLMTRGGEELPKSLVEEERQKRASTPAGVLPRVQPDEEAIGLTGEEPSQSSGTSSENKGEKKQ